LTERPFSELLRQPKSVIEDLESGDVLLRRRGAPPLRLSVAGRDADRADGLAVVGRALRNLAANAPEAVSAALLDEFPWISFLPSEDRATFVDEFIRTALAVAELDNFGALGQLLADWKATAEIHSDPSLAGHLRKPVRGSGGPVAVPVA
jgi:hypothetical protein